MNPENSESEGGRFSGIARFAKQLASILAVVAAAVAVIIILLFGIPWGMTQVAPYQHDISKEYVWYVVWWAVLFGWATANLMFGWAQSDDLE